VNTVGLRYIGAGLVLAIGAIACAIAGYAEVAVGLAVVGSVAAVVGVFRG
jgi:hypothetical protein